MRSKGLTLAVAAQADLSAEMKNLRKIINLQRFTKKY